MLGSLPAERLMYHETFVDGRAGLQPRTEFYAREAAIKDVFDTDEPTSSFADAGNRHVRFDDLRQWRSGSSWRRAP
jgi:hypothetical protein